MRIGRLILLPWGTCDALDVRSGYAGRDREFEPFEPFEAAEMGISPTVVVKSRNDELLEDLSSPRSNDLVAGESCGARCDFRLCRSIMLIAHASRSTGVRFAACKNGSCSLKLY